MTENKEIIMKKLKKFMVMTMAGVMLASAVALGGCSGKSNKRPKDMGQWTVESPDGSIKSAVVMDADGKLSYSVTKNGTAVVEKSALGFDIAEDDLRLLTVENSSSRRVTGEYENITGKHAEVSYDCNETTITFKAWEFYLDVIMRAYDDGYAYRYNIRAIDGSSGTMTVLAENSEFALPKSAQLWTQPYKTSAAWGREGEFFAYENAYVYKNVSGLGGSTLAMPLLYKVGDGDLYSLVTESDLIGSGFYGSFLKEQESNYGTGILQTVHTPAGITKNDNKVAYPFTSPWRLGSVGTLATVVESEMHEKVYDDVTPWRPDNYDELSDDEKKIYDYEWVEPGVSTFNWLRYPGVENQKDYELHREYLDLAVAMGWKYHILDGNWDNDLENPTQKAAFLDFMDYAKQKGVKVIVWCDAYKTFGKGKKELLVETLDRYQSWGVAGIKIDFFSGETVENPPHQSEDIGAIEWYETIYQECAKRQMVVNAHGSNKPTGERRKYPNVINREGIYGNEFDTVDSTVTVNHMFTRNLLGAADFTPCVKPRNRGLTVGHQMALAVLFESGIPSMGDYASEYYDETVNSYYKALPAKHDETLFLGGEPDMYYCAAIKSGEEWFVACINAVVPSSVPLDFSFLGAGEYTADVWTDVDGNNMAVTKTQKTVTNATKETVEIGRNCGFIYHIYKQA